MAFVPTPEQSAFTDALRATYPRNVAENAGAGTGKSTTLFYGIETAIPTKHNVQVCAFNRKIAEEFKAKAAKLGRRNVFVNTFNSLGFGLLRQHFGAKFEEFDVDDSKIDRLVQDWISENQPHRLTDREHFEDAVSCMVKLVRMFMVNTTTPVSQSRELVTFLGNDEETDEPIYVHYDPKDIETLSRVAARYGIGLDPTSDDPENDRSPRDMEAIKAGVDEILAKCWRLLENPLKRKLDPTEQLFWPVVLRIIPKWQSMWVMVDEAQDISPVSRALVDMHVLRLDGRLVGRVAVIGDPEQAIYAFSGADNHGFENSLRYWNIPKALTLSITRRCPKIIVERVQIYKPGYTAAPEAPDGIAAAVQQHKALQMLDPERRDAVISRTRANLIAVWRQCIKMGKPAVIIGADVSSQIIRILKLVSGHVGFEFDKLDEYIEAHKERKLARMIKARKSESDIDAFRDTITCVVEAVEAVREKFQPATFEAMIEHIRALFRRDNDDEKPQIQIMTGHTSKGLEFERVFNWTPKLFPLNRKGQSDEDYLQECHLHYVVETRTIGEYYLVVEKPDDLDGTYQILSDTAVPIPEPIAPVPAPPEPAAPIALIEAPSDYPFKPLPEPPSFEREMPIFNDAPSRSFYFENLSIDVRKLPGYKK